MIRLDEVPDYNVRWELTEDEIKEPYEEEIIISQPFDYVLRLCKRSVQLLTEFTITDIKNYHDDCTILGVSQSNFDIITTFRIIKTSANTTRITIHSIVNIPAYDYHRPTSASGETRLIVTTLVRFLQEYSGKDEELPDYQHRQISREIPPYVPADAPEPVLSPGDSEKSGFRKQSPWLLAGIILLLCGIIIDYLMVMGILGGTVDITSKYFKPGPNYHYFLLPLLPGGIAFYFWILGQPAPSISGKGDPTGICVGRHPFYKNPKIAAVLSLFIPGMGQAYNGQSALGMLFAFGAGAGLLFALVPGILVWLFSIWHAYSMAQEINHETIPFAPVNNTAIIVILGIFIPCFVVTCAFFWAFGPMVVLGMTSEKICTVVHCG
jgi:hypothetical protein